MKVNEYKVISDCVERGVARGYAQAFKHDDAPSADAITATIESAVLNELCEYFMFEPVPQ